MVRDQAPVLRGVDRLPVVAQVLLRTLAAQRLLFPVVPAVVLLAVVSSTCPLRVLRDRVQLQKEWVLILVVRSQMAPGVVMPTICSGCSRSGRRRRAIRMIWNESSRMLKKTGAGMSVVRSI